MTIAIGVLCGEGIVLAADTQETAQNFMKTDVQKIHSAEYVGAKGRGSISVTGAGRGGYVDSIAQDWLEWFLDHQDIDLKDVVIEYKARLHAFYQQHVIPFGADRPDVGLIVGLQRDGKGTLISSELSTLREHDLYVSVGVGEVFAHSLLDLYCDIPVVMHGTIGQAAKLAAYIIYRVKEVIDTCGHRTQLVALKHGRVIRVHPQIVNGWDEHFARFDLITAYALRSVAAGVSGELDESLKDLAERLGKEPISLKEDQ